MTNQICRGMLVVMFACGAFFVSEDRAAAQYSMIGTPFQSAGGGFYENYNLGWGIQGNGFGFNWNGGNANPPFGPFDPNAQAQLGGAFRAGPFSGGFRLTAGQRADSTLVSQTPSVTVMNGATGYFSDTTVRPFVTAIVPVVGAGGYNIQQPLPGAIYSSPLQERIARLQAQNRLAREAEERGEVHVGLGSGGSADGPSSAERGAASVADIKAGQAAAEAARQKEIGELLMKADALAAEGKNGVAKIFYQQAARRAEGEQRAEIAARIKQLE